MATHALPASHIIDDDETEAPARAAAPRKRALLRRFHDALMESQMRRAEREIDRVLGPGALARALRAELPKER